MGGIVWLWYLAQSAFASDLEWVSKAYHSKDTIPVLSRFEDQIACPGSMDAIGGYGWSYFGGMLSTARPVGGEFRAIWENEPWHQRDPTWPVSPEGFLEVAALCAERNSCFLEASTVVPQDATASKTGTAVCRTGMFAIAGGFEVTGAPAHVGVTTSGASGLFLPTGWRVTASGVGADDWGLTVFATCASADVASHVRYLPFSNWGCGNVAEVPGVNVRTSAPLYSGPLWPAPDGPGKMLPLSVSATIQSFTVPYAMSGTSIRNTFNYPIDPAATDFLTATATATNAAPAPVEAYCPLVDAHTFSVSASDRDAFEAAAWSCPWQIVIDRWWLLLTADILFGVIGDGGGVIWLPGKGPVPIGPGPLREAIDGLPVGVATYVDRDQLQIGIREAGSAIEAAGAGWVSLMDIRETDTAIEAPGEGWASPTEIRETKTDGSDERVVFVTPESGEAEVAAVRWLVENRERLASLEHPTVLFLEHEGDGRKYLTEVWR